MADIPQEVTEMQNDGDIPKIVAELPQESDVAEIEPYKISFSKYNEKLCEISLLGKNRGNRALTILKEIGTKVFSRADFQRHDIQTKGVAYDGAYKPLYNKIADGIEIKELFLQGDGRIFYFDIEPARMLYVVAIKENHFETGKVRR
jgi:hypothetical protein